MQGESRRRGGDIEEHEIGFPFTAVMNANVYGINKNIKFPINYLQNNSIQHQLMYIYVYKYTDLEVKKL